MDDEDVHRRSILPMDIDDGAAAGTSFRPSSRGRRTAASPDDEAGDWDGNKDLDGDNEDLEGGQDDDDEEDTIRQLHLLPEVQDQPTLVVIVHDHGGVDDGDAERDDHSHPLMLVMLLLRLLVNGVRGCRDDDDDAVASSSTLAALLDHVPV
jgi:hypothetical protein